MLGRGSFGTVKFALCVVGDEENKISTAEIICIKKSKHIKEGNTDSESTTVTLKEIIKSSLGDYLVDNIGDYVFAPKVYDMAVNQFTESD